MKRDNLVITSIPSFEPNTTYKKQMSSWRSFIAKRKINELNYFSAQTEPSQAPLGAEPDPSGVRFRRASWRVQSSSSSCDLPDKTSSQESHKSVWCSCVFPEYHRFSSQQSTNVYICLCLFSNFSGRDRSELKASGLENRSGPLVHHCVSPLSWLVTLICNLICSWETTSRSSLGHYYHNTQQE